jgi:hypothetical protein
MDDPQDAAMYPAPGSLGLDASVIQFLGDCPQRFTAPMEFDYPGDGLLFLGVFD